MNNDQIMGLILALSALFLGTVYKIEAYSILRESDKDSDKDERERDKFEWNYDYYGGKWNWGSRKY